MPMVRMRIHTYASFFLSCISVGVCCRCCRLFVAACVARRCLHMHMVMSTLGGMKNRQTVFDLHGASRIQQSYISKRTSCIIYTHYTFAHCADCSCSMCA